MIENTSATRQHLADFSGDKKNSHELNGEQPFFDDNQGKVGNRNDRLDTDLKYLASFVENDQNLEQRVDQSSTTYFKKVECLVE